RPHEHVAAHPVEGAQKTEAYGDRAALVPGGDTDREKVDAGEGGIDPGKIIDEPGHRRECEKERKQRGRRKLLEKTQRSSEHVRLFLPVSRYISPTCTRSDTIVTSFVILPP